MFAQIFAVIQLLLKLVGLWEAFLSWSDKARLAEAAQNTQEREKAVDQQKGAQNEDDFDRAQDDIVNHRPH